MALHQTIESPDQAIEDVCASGWIGFPVAYAVSGILLTVFGYFAMVLAA